MRLLTYLIFVFFLQGLTIAQTDESIQKMQSAYSSFNYSEVILLGEKNLNSDTEYSKEEMIEIHKLMGLANYSLNEMDEARKCFVELLKLDKSLQLNPTLIPPKIITFFNNIRDDYEKLVPETEIAKPDSNISSSQNIAVETYLNSMNDRKYAITQSIILPGLGHIYSGQKTKGWILTVGSAGLLGSMFYAIFETQNREEAYMKETDLNLIRSKYDSYNSMYKTRNILIGAYVVVWLYAQIDLILFNDELPDEIFTIQNNGPTTNPSLSFNVSFW